MHKLKSIEKKQAKLIYVFLFYSLRSSPSDVLCNYYIKKLHIVQIKNSLKILIRSIGGNMLT